MWKATKAKYIFSDNFLAFFSDSQFVLALFSLKASWLNNLSPYDEDVNMHNKVIKHY